MLSPLDDDLAWCTDSAIRANCREVCNLLLCIRPVCWINCLIVGKCRWAPVRPPLPAFSRGGGYWAEGRWEVGA